MARKRVLIAFGTRPEAIKLAPVVLALRRSDSLESLVCGTAQHRQMLDQVLNVFDIELDFDLKLMRSDQGPADVLSRGLPLFMDLLRDTKPDLVLVQGDTTSTFLGAFAAFLSKVPVAHVEAGLRTFDKYQPFPEELNRRLTAAISDFHFAPTQSAKQNLLLEGVKEERITVTGNTVIDALFLVLRRKNEVKVLASAEPSSRLILVTAHRRESLGEPLRRICSALKRIASEHPDCVIVFPVHPNPNVRSIVFPLLSGLENVRLIEPMGYDEFVWLMKESFVIVTDSGGIQEEAPSLGKPVLVLRDKTERPEGPKAGVAILVGSQPDRICDETSKLLNDPSYYDSFASRTNPYGDGRASERIVEFVREHI